MTGIRTAPLATLAALSMLGLAGGCGGRTGQFVDAPALTRNDDGASTMADAAATASCSAGCTIAFASGPDWDSFAGTSISTVAGPPIGPAKEVCLLPTVPTNCPINTAGVVIYNFGPGSGWMAGSSLPQAHWIWRGDVTLAGAADLKIGIFEKGFVLGANPSGTMQIGADDFAAIFVNDTMVGSVGSVSDVQAATASQNGLVTFNLAPTLRAGANKITVVGQNGPARYGGGCGATGCSYSLNPAGVVFAGTLAWQ